MVLLATLTACSPRVTRAPAPTAKVVMPAREVIAGILQSGRQALAQGRVERAISLFRRVQEGYPGAPELPEATLILAQALEANGDLTSALAEYRRLAEGFTRTPQAVLARTKIPGLEGQLAIVRLPEVSQVLGKYVRADEIETLEERDLMRLRQAGLNTLVIEVAQNRSATGKGSSKTQEAGVYFQTDWATVLQDRLASLANGAHRQGIRVWAAVSVRRMDWIDSTMEWSDWRYSPQNDELEPAETLDLLHPVVREYLVGFFTDLAAAGVDGLLLVADPPSRPGEGFSPYALRQYERDIGQSLEPSRLRLSQAGRSLAYAPEFWRWVGWKQREQFKVVDGVLRAVRRVHPHLKVAIAVHPEVVSSPRAALAWYAEDLLDLRRYRIDYIALSFSSSASGGLGGPPQAEMGSWANKLAELVPGERLLLVVAGEEQHRLTSFTLPAGTGLIYRDGIR